jgi:ubiquitin-protein ligase
MPAEDPRIRRLRSEYEHLMELKARSDLIDFQYFLVLPDTPPERYIVTFRCRGIASVDASRRPVYSNEHKVAIYLDATYPSIPPRMKWLTPIWHPNIEHKEPHRVCIDNTWWAPGRTIDKVVLMLGEMVQYKNFHPYQTPPYPIDPEVASWVLWAQAQGILKAPVDTAELRRPERVRTNLREEQPPPKPRVRVIDDRADADENRVRIVE